MFTGCRRNESVTRMKRSEIRGLLAAWNAPRIALRFIRATIDRGYLLRLIQTTRYDMPHNS